MEEGRERAVWRGVIAGMMGFLMAAAGVAISWWRLPPEVPIFYSLPWGERQLVDKGWLWAILGGFGLAWWANIVIAWRVAKEEWLLRVFLVWGGAGVEILLAMALWRMIWVII